MVVGNKELRPEKSAGGNIGCEYFWKSFVLINVNYFQNKFKDMIVDYQAAPLTFSYLNVERAAFHGVEWQSRWYVLDNLTATIGYNYTKISHADDAAAFSKISPHNATIRIGYGLFRNRVKLSLKEQYLSAREIVVVTHEGLYQKSKKKGYHILDLTCSYKLNEAFFVRLCTTNLTDYRDLAYGPYIGRRFFVGIQIGI